MRNLLIAGLAAMSLIAFGACGGDEEETSTKECTSNADCGEGKICGAEGKCVDDTNVTPGPVDECTTNDDCTDATKPVCDNGTCVADSTVTEGCSTDADCTDAALPICDNGTCVADSTQPVECGATEYEIDGACYGEGDMCDSATFVETCADDVVVYCLNGVVTTFNCGDYEGAFCDTLTGQNYADCYDADYISEISCTAGSEASTECVYDYDESYNVTYYSADYVCVQLTEDGSYVWHNTAADECDGSCNEDTGLCVEVAAGWTCDAEFYGDGDCDCGCGVVDVDCTDNSYESCDYHTGCIAVGYVNPSDSTACVTVEGVGVTCDPDTYTQKCDENVAVYCTATDYEIDYDNYELVYTYSAVATNCESAACGVINGEVDCHSAEDACEAGDARKQVCYEGSYADYSAEYACQATDDGDYYYYYTDVTGDTWDECETTCNATTGLCD